MADETVGEGPKGGKATLTSLREGSTDSRAVQAYYDNWASTYDETLKEWRYVAPADAADLLIPLLQEGAEILDVGCGTGGMGAVLAARGGYLIDGLDISATSLAHAGQRGVYRNLKQCDLQQLPLPFAENTFDAAVSVGVLTYIEDASALMQDLCRVVRPGGIIAFSMRSDLWTARAYPKMLRNLASTGAWQVHHISAPMPYSPGNDSFLEEIKVIHTLCRVGIRDAEGANLP